MRKLSSQGLRRTTDPDGEPRPRVLYVEDEKDNVDVLAYRLAKHYKILWAQNDREAIELLREHEGNLHAILMDIQLMGSHLDGIQLTRAIRAIPPPEPLPELDQLPAVPVLPEVPIIFLTGYISRYSREELGSAGGNALLGKPFDFHELLEALGQLGEARAARQAEQGV